MIREVIKPTSGDLHIKLPDECYKVKSIFVSKPSVGVRRLQPTRIGLLGGLGSTTLVNHNHFYNPNINLRYFCAIIF